MQSLDPTQIAAVEAAVEAAVVELHDFFEAWFDGTLPATQAAFAPVERALGPSFVIVSPNGQAQAREALLAGLFGVHGSQRAARLKIRVERIEVEALGPHFALARYEEWHESAAGKRGRLSSAVFDCSTPTPVWRSVHETWLPE